MQRYSLILSVLVSLVFAHSSFADRCFASKDFEQTTPDPNYYYGVTKMWIQVPSPGEAGPFIIFSGEGYVSRTLILCTENSGKPYCGIESDGGGFNHSPLNMNPLKIKTTGIPGIYTDDSGSSRPGFGIGPARDFELTEVKESECLNAVPSGRTVQAVKKSNGSPSRTKKSVQKPKN